MKTPGGQSGAKRRRIGVVRRAVRTRIGERGQVMVEFVLVLPILLVLVIGIIEFASAWRTSQLITNIAREGARFSVVAGGPGPGDEATVEDSVRTLLTNAGLDGDVGTVTATLGAGSGDPDQVRIEYPYEFVFFGPAIELMTGGGGQYGQITLVASSVMRNE